MSNIPSLPPKKVIKALSKFGIIPIRQKGSHVFVSGFYKGREQNSVVPIHDYVFPNMLKTILKQLNINVIDFLREL